MDIVLHVRVLLGMIVGLGVAHLLRGVARIVQHPQKYEIYWVHLTWAFFMFLYLIHFWWWEFWLNRVTHWTFPVYFFVAVYATLVYLLCTLIFPDEIVEYNGFRDYFYSRKNWFFSLMALLFIADIADTFIKGSSYRAPFGVAFYVREAGYIVLALIAIKVKSPQFHAVFAVCAVVFEVIFIFKFYLTLG